MMESEQVALIDLDGTVADFDGGLREKLVALANPDEDTDDETLERLREEPWMTARRRLIKTQSGFWRDLRPLPGGLRVVHLMKELGFRLMVLTKGPFRGTAAWTEKVEWCREHLPDVPVTITEDKGLVYGRVLFDDWPSYIERWLEWRPRGLVIMTDQLWNRDFEHPNVFRFIPKESGVGSKHMDDLMDRLIQARDR